MGCVSFWSGLKERPQRFRFSYAALASSYSPHTLLNEVCGALEGQDLGLGTKRAETHDFGRLRQEGFPLGGRPEHEHDHLISCELTPSGIKPDDRFLLFRAQQDHVVIRSHHDLARPLGVI